MRARRITIDGIAVDGGGPYVFGAKEIWAAEGGTPDCRWPLQHGNAAITLWIAGDVVIRTVISVTLISVLLLKTETKVASMPTLTRQISNLSL